MIAFERRLPPEMEEIIEELIRTEGEDRVSAAVAGLTAGAKSAAVARDRVIRALERGTLLHLA